MSGQASGLCTGPWAPSQSLIVLLLCRVPFWRFLITGADQNQELKMWCTVSWTCLQTIR